MLALKWENVNLKDKYIEVKESVKKVYIFDSDGNKKLETIYQKPKSLTSIRKVDLPNKIIDMLSNMDRSTVFVFEDENGNPYSAKTLFGNWKKVLKNNNKNFDVNYAKRVIKEVKQISLIKAYLCYYAFNKRCRLKNCSGLNGTFRYNYYSNLFACTA